MIRNWQKIIYSRLHVHGITLYPFIVIKTIQLKDDPVFLQHEHIHLRQQAEMLVLPFYIVYLLNYLINRFRFSSHTDAYRNICFEKEAYQHQNDPGYLKKRNGYSWIRYL